MKWRLNILQIVQWSRWICKTDGNLSHIFLYLHSSWEARNKQTFKSNKRMPFAQFGQNLA